jgi:hypothetical protein
VVDARRATHCPAGAYAPAHGFFMGYSGETQDRIFAACAATLVRHKRVVSHHDIGQPSLCLT